MKPLSDNYKNAKTISERERLPIGGYVLKILGVEYQTNQYGDTIVLSFDVEEGEQKGFYARDYKAQSGEDKKWRGNYRLRVPKDDGSENDEWTMRRFKTVITNFEESNSGFHWDWDENKLKGKLIGGIFNNKEWEMNGRTGFFTNCHSLVTVESIRTGKFKIPADTLLRKRDDNNGFPATGPSGDADFMNIPANIDEDLPFN